MATRTASRKANRLGAFSGQRCVLLLDAVAAPPTICKFKFCNFFEARLVLTGREIVRGTAVLALVEPAGPPCGGRREPHEAV